MADAGLKIIENRTCGGSDCSLNPKKVGSAPLRFFGNNFFSANV